MIGPRTLPRKTAFVVLLLLTAAIRLHNLTAQEPFIDEGAHVQRARVVWEFHENPGRFSNGKVLLYFWLGVFELPPIAASWIARAAIALTSLVTGAAVYALGRAIHGAGAGLVALGLYAVLPLAFFFERLALADPLASMFVTLMVWRSLVLMQHPSIREAVVVGFLAAAATLAKLTVGLAPLLPGIAAVLCAPASGAEPRARIAAWRRRYGRALAVIAGIVVLCWLPLLIPAGLAYTRGDAFTLVNGANMAGLDSAAPLAELRDAAPAIAEFVSPGLALAGALAIGWLGWAYRRDHRARAHLMLVLSWAVLIALLPLLAARDPRPRYFMPLAAPLSVGIGWAAASLWDTRQRVLRLALTLSAAAWLGGFALPFIRTAVTEPRDLPLSGHSAAVYLGGNFAGEAMRQAVTLLDTVEPPPDQVLADRATCDMLYFFTARPITCAADIARPVELLAAPASYVVLNGHEPQPDRMGLTWELAGEYERPALQALAGVTRTVQVWRVTPASR